MISAFAARLRLQEIITNTARSSLWYVQRERLEFGVSMEVSLYLTRAVTAGIILIVQCR